jgi:hypothetical protein
MHEFMCKYQLATREVFVVDLRHSSLYTVQGGGKGFGVFHPFNERSAWHLRHDNFLRPLRGESG